MDHLTRISLWRRGDVFDGKGLEHLGNTVWLGMGLKLIAEASPSEFKGHTVHRSIYNSDNVVQGFRGFKHGRKIQKSVLLSKSRGLLGSWMSSLCSVLTRCHVILDLLQLRKISTFV